VPGLEHREQRCAIARCHTRRGLLGECDEVRHVAAAHGLGFPALSEPLQEVLAHRVEESVALTRRRLEP
jgi:hypothetical protein